jgi:hypothetical protein
MKNKLHQKMNIFLELIIPCVVYGGKENETNFPSSSRRAA